MYVKASLSCLTNKRYILCCQLLILYMYNFHLSIVYMTFDRKKKDIEINAYI